MRQGIWRSSPALVISAIALFVALGGSVYAAKKAKMNGAAIRAKSLPGNRLKPRSVPANRLKPSVLRDLRAAVLPAGPLTGAEIDELTLGQVPSAAHAESADFAQSAAEAQVALSAIEAVNAQTVNGYGAGCFPGTTTFAGACWQSSPSSATTAPVAAEDCAAQGGALPEALQLAAFAAEPGVSLDEGDEWTSDIVNFTAEDAYAVATVSDSAAVGSALFNKGGASANRAYRCVIPLLR